MSWECPECGEINNDDSSVHCVCGYMDNDLQEKATEDYIPEKSPKKPLTGKQILKKTTRFVGIVLLVGWVTLISKQTAGRPFFLGKTFMVTSFTISVFCIYPMAKVVGPKSIILKPVRMVRDGLFNIGWKILPEDDGERELHWFGNYYLLNPIKDDMSNYLDDEGKWVYSTTGYEQYFGDVSHHLEPLATLPMKDKINRQRRYKLFFRSAKAYYLFMAEYLKKRYGVDYYKREIGTEYMKNLRRHFQLFLKLREHTKETSPQVYNDYATFQNEWWYVLHIYLRGACTKLIYEDYSLGHLDCSGDLVKEFLQAREDTLLRLPEDNWANENEKIASYRAIFQTNSEIAEGTIFNLIKQQCENPEVQQYPEHPTKTNNSRTIRD
ncbi:hypothetical protein UWK_00406 [Desulfocapsa sulfexigens DSM 10523]|uniref:Uncharacterized protein n=1 Tax=Desulfocapsa sulfexigens (strain DSM 10523 / SB164P1) TaxID=1167006 RepID=M1PKJ6_DESSD|nr:hypothetical protein [Desulfocapsa sulfexigens]AGF76991.1 hypothetical protein UWK_00406 [Desulfocapsa sulfexigens DSM 10523]